MRRWAFGLIALLMLAVAGQLTQPTSSPITADESLGQSWAIVYDQPAAGGKNWHTELVASGSADAIGATTGGQILVQSGWVIIDRDAGNWTAHSVSPPSGAGSPRDFYVDSSNAYFAADGPDGAPSPFNYNGGYGTDIPGKSYLVYFNPITNSSSSTTISGSAIGWGAYSDGTYGPSNKCSYHRNAKNPILAGSTLITVAWRKDVFTNGGAGWCSIQSSLVSFTRTATMTGTTPAASSWSSGSSSGPTLCAAAKSPNGTVTILTGSSCSFVALDDNDQTWYASGTGVGNGATGYTFSNGSVTEFTPSLERQQGSR